MDTKVMILSACVYEKNGKKLTRIEFVMGDTEDITENDNYVGLTTLSSYYTGNKKSLVTKDMIAKPLEARFKSIKDIKDPLKVRQILESVIYNGDVISFI